METRFLARLLALLFLSLCIFPSCNVAQKCDRRDTYNSCADCAAYKGINGLITCRPNTFKTLTCASNSNNGDCAFDCLKSSCRGSCPQTKCSRNDNKYSWLRDNCVWSVGGGSLIEGRVQITDSFYAKMKYYARREPQIQSKIDMKFNKISSIGCSTNISHWQKITNLNNVKTLNLNVNPHLRQLGSLDCLPSLESLEINNFEWPN
jgi:hypothetical protein